MKKTSLSVMLVSLAVQLIMGTFPGDASAKEHGIKDVYAKVENLERRLAELEYKIGVQEDIEAIRTLMYTYTYYMDRSLYTQVLDLFSENTVSCEAGGRGIYLGKEGCVNLWMNIWGIYGGAQNKQPFGTLIEHHVTKLVITVDPDRKHAESRGHFFSMGGIYNRPDSSSMQMGIYQLQYVKENGVWKISKWWLPFTTTGYNFSTWAENPGYSGCPSEQNPPDLPTSSYHPFPEVYVVPFHYPNPVTGEAVPQNGYTDPTRYWLGNWPDEWGQCGHR